MLAEWREKTALLQDAGLPTPETMVCESPADAMAAVLAAHARGEAYMPLRSVMAAPGAGGDVGQVE